MPCQKAENGRGDKLIYPKHGLVFHIFTYSRHQTRRDNVCREVMFAEQKSFLHLLCITELMASISITAFTQRTLCSSQAQHTTKKPSPTGRPTSSLGTKIPTGLVNPSIGGLQLSEKQDKKDAFSSNKIREAARDEVHHSQELHPRFSDERWKNGTWDLNMFVDKDRVDWDALIVAEAKRRRYIEIHPEASSNEEPVLFRSSIIPWWAWMAHSHLPEAEILNGRAAMVGFFMAYLVDAFTGLNVVGQTGNFLCKAALLFTVIGILVFRRNEDIGNLQKMADEATFYDKQWQASWENGDE